MRYVSTRGEAAPLDFVEVMLAGLARDGGLYVPESWPALGRETITGFAGKPYAEVAVDVIRPFVDGCIADGDVARMVREAYGGFRHPATAPLVQLDSSLFVLELFHGPTLAFKDLAMQLVARLMDHALRQRSERTTIVVATSGDTGGAAAEAFRGSGQVDVVVLFPSGRISDVQQRMMTTVPDANVHAVAIEGTFDDCQALVKAMFNHHAFRDRVRLSASTRSTGRALWRKPSTISRLRWRSERRVGKSPSRCRPGTLATSMPAMWPHAWGCQSIALWSRQTPTTSLRGHLPPALTKSATLLRPCRRRWTFKCRQISSVCCSMRPAAMQLRCAH